MVYTTILIESHWLMRYNLVLEEFGPNIHYTFGVDNIVADKLSILSYKFVGK